MTKSGYQLAQRAHFLRGKYIIIHNPKDGWARCLKKDPRFHKLGTVRFVPVPLVVRDPTTDRPTPAYVQFLLRLQGAVQTIGGSPEKIKVVLGPTHGGDDGKITKALNGEVDGAAPYWWTAGDHLRPFYDMGIRRLHWQTCLIGKHLMSMPRVLTKCASPLVVIQSGPSALLRKEIVPRIPTYSKAYHLPQRCGKVRAAPGIPWLK